MRLSPVPALRLSLSAAPALGASITLSIPNFNVFRSSLRGEGGVGVLCISHPHYTPIFGTS
jgi:hypothetical protein